jgi:hypothetical protein
VNGLTGNCSSSSGSSKVVATPLDPISAADLGLPDNLTPPFTIAP